MDKISDKINKACEKYSDNIFLRASVASIPFIGSQLDLIFSFKGSKIIQSRIMYLLDCLKIKLSLIEKNKIDMGYIESEYFF